jgi:hypothetical protein
MFFIRSVPTILTQSRQNGRNFLRNSQFSFAQSFARVKRCIGNPRTPPPRTPHQKEKIPRFSRGKCQKLHAFAPELYPTESEEIKSGLVALSS